MGLPVPLQFVHVMPVGVTARDAVERDYESVATGLVTLATGVAVLHHATGAPVSRTAAVAPGQASSGRPTGRTSADADHRTESRTKG